MKHPSFHARTTPDKVAYLMAGSGASLTYKQLESRSNQGAHLLRRMGVGAGGNIAILMENRLEFFEVMWAAHRSGVLYTAVSRHLGADEAGYIVNDCGAKILFLSEAYANLVPSLRERLQPEVAIVIAGAHDPSGAPTWRELCDREPETPIADECCGADLLYSSGTTGRPKGIVLEHEPGPIDTVNPLLTLLCETMGGMTAASVYLSPAPLYHAAPLRFTRTAANIGATTIVMEKFDPEAFLRLVEEHHVTHTQLVPTMFVRLLKLPEEVRATADVSSLRCAIHAAAPCPVEIKERMIAWWGPVILEYYAGTEGNGVTVVDSEAWLKHPGTVGRSLIGSIVIADGDGHELPPGQIGRVYFDSGRDFVYRGDADKTEAAFLRPGCGTLGDIGSVDEEGYLYLSDRADYMIISGGVNIYPQETEDILICHPAVADAAVFGVPNEDLGEEVKAVVQLQDGARPGPDMEAELIAYVRSRISSLKAPRSIDFRDQLPRTPTGKLMKRILKEEYKAAARAPSGALA
ncbi:acyl-CoA synthetase [Acuticoccus sediminis]|uniref:acyl-CoA synthetase n=1 Tax=Acuticoccus sediminis TaxID=2184697 RepID=UPI001CFC615F|nr:acyl-CoA synthetase [Acuticoccus sediminis]